MGTVASSWFPAGMTENAGNEFKRPKKSSRKSVQIGHTSASPNKTIEHSYGITWNECLRHVMVYLDSNTMSILSSVSRCWSQHFDHRGSRASSEAISNLLGREYGQRLSLLGKAETESTAVTDWEISPRRYWTQACDLLVGHLHSNVPRGSQSSTSMALALVSDFMMCAQTVQLPENVVHVDVNRLCSDSYLLAFTAITIAIKVEVKIAQIFLLNALMLCIHL